MKDKMLEERRKWVLEYMERREFTGVPYKGKEFYDKDKVRPPLTAEEEALEEEKEKEKKKGKKGKGKGKGKKGKLSELDEFLEDYKPTGPT